MKPLRILLLAAIIGRFAVAADLSARREDAGDHGSMLGLLLFFSLVWR